MGSTVGTAESFHGVADFVEMIVPAIAAEDGCSVPAWAGSWWTPDAAVITVAQPDSRSLTSDLYCPKPCDRWPFNQDTSQLATARAVRAMAGTANGVKLRQWTQLVSACSSASKKLKLYVQGMLVGATPYSAASDACRGLRLGGGGEARATALETATLATVLARISSPGQMSH